MLQPEKGGNRPNYLLWQKQKVVQIFAMFESFNNLGKMKMLFSNLSVNTYLKQIK